MNIVFNKNFYSVKAIRQAVEAYKGLAVFNIKEKAENIEVDIDEIGQDVKNVIKDEFCNYVLAEAKKLRQ